jgi:hypothetical protein
MNIQKTGARYPNIRQANTIQHIHACTVGGFVMTVEADPLYEHPEDGGQVIKHQAG